MYSIVSRTSMQSELTNYSYVSFDRFISNVSHHYNEKLKISKHNLFFTDNMASKRMVSQNPSGSQPASLANDGNKTSCSKTIGKNVTFQVDLMKESIVTGMYIIFGGMLLRNI